ncbi:uncharacterized protein [Dermacentor andersoni]|uniref:uncharacterized protein n=1 Tax=Dermacentor andersoni TaxID=34620 RepID=UPI003B3BC5B5
MGPFAVALCLLAVTLAASSQADGSFFAAKLGKRTYFSEDEVCSEALQRKVRWAGGRFTRRYFGYWPLRGDPESRTNESSLLELNLFTPTVADMRIHGCSMEMNVSAILIGAAELVLPAATEEVRILGSGHVVAKISWPGPRVDNASLTAFRFLVQPSESEDSGHAKLIAQATEDLLMNRISKQLPEFFLRVMGTGSSRRRNQIHHRNRTMPPLPCPMGLQQYRLPRSNYTIVC